MVAFPTENKVLLHISSLTINKSSQNDVKMLAPMALKAANAPLETSSINQRKDAESTQFDRLKKIWRKQKILNLIFSYAIESILYWRTVVALGWNSSLDCCVMKIDRHPREGDSKALKYRSEVEFCSHLTLKKYKTAIRENYAKLGIYLCKDLLKVFA